MLILVPLSCLADLNEPDILNLIRANRDHNETFVNAEFVVTALDFTNMNWPTDLEKCIKEADIILAADGMRVPPFTASHVRR